MLLLVPWMVVLNVFVLTHGCELLMRFKLCSMAFLPNNLLGSWDGGRRARIWWCLLSGAWRAALAVVVGRGAESKDFGGRRVPTTSSAELTAPCRATRERLRNRPRACGNSLRLPESFACPGATGSCLSRGSH